MLMAQTTTLVVQFGTDSALGVDSHLSAEIDSRPDGKNLGVTRFNPGDTAYFLVFRSPDLTTIQVYPSAFSAGLTGETVQVEKTETLTFAGTREANLPVPVASGFTYKWLGNNLGTITVDGTKATCADGGPDKVGVAKVTYLADALVGQITSQATLDEETDFAIAVLIVGSAAAA